MLKNVLLLKTMAITLDLVVCHESWAHSSEKSRRGENWYHSNLITSCPVDVAMAFRLTGLPAMCLCAHCTHTFYCYWRIYKNWRARAHQQNPRGHKSAARSFSLFISRRHVIWHGNLILDDVVCVLLINFCLFCDRAERENTSVRAVLSQPRRAFNNICCGEFDRSGRVSLLQRIQNTGQIQSHECFENGIIGMAIATIIGHKDANIMIPWYFCVALRVEDLLLLNNCEIKLILS